MSDRWEIYATEDGVIGLWDMLGRNDVLSLNPTGISIPLDQLVELVTTMEENE